MTKIPDNIKLLSGCEIGNKLLKQEICPVELINYYLDNIKSLYLFNLCRDTPYLRFPVKIKNLKQASLNDYIISLGAGSNYERFLNYAVERVSDFD